MVAHMELCSLCATGEDHSIGYTTTIYEVHTFKNKNKRKSLLRDIFVYHFLVYICLLVAADMLQ